MAVTVGIPVFNEEEILRPNTLRLVEYLRQRYDDFEVVLAVDGQAGVDMASSSSPDLILMDLSLPVIDGWEATRMIKADPATQSIPVIALTAHAMKEDEHKARDAGCDDYDTKPVNLKRLLEKMSNLLGSP